MHAHVFVVEQYSRLYPQAKRRSSLTVNSALKSGHNARSDSSVFTKPTFSRGKAQLNDQQAQKGSHDSQGLHATEGRLQSALSAEHGPLLFSACRGVASRLWQRSRLHTALHLQHNRLDTALAYK